MNTRVFHLMKGLLRNMRWEIALMVVVSATVSGWAILDVDSVPTLAFRWLEIACAGWLGFRLALAESGFRIHGGWETRPFRRRDPLDAQVGVLILVFLPLLVLRAYSVQAVMAPTLEGWVWILRSTWLPVIGWGGLVFALTAIIGRRLALGARGRIPTGVIAVFLLFGFSLMGILDLDKRKRPPIWPFPSSENDQASLAGLLKATLPPETDVLGRKRVAIPKTPGLPLIEEIIRLPIRVGERVSRGNVSGEIQWMSTGEDRLELVFVVSEIGEPSRRMFGFAVRYSDGTYGTISEGRVMPSVPNLPLVPSHRVPQKGSFYSPKQLPGQTATWTELLEGAELIVYRAGTNDVDFRDPAPARLIEIEAPPYPEKDDPLLIDDYVSSLRDYSNQWVTGLSELRLGSREIPYLLRYEGWSDEIWNPLVKPVLIDYADESHRAGILKVLRHDPRMGSVVVAKGWFDEALPIVRQQLLDGAELPVECLRELAKLHDPALARSLVWNFLRRDNDVTELGALLRGHPDVDWKEVVRKGWRWHAYGRRKTAPTKTFAVWASETGDREALRWLGEQAVLGDADSLNEVRRLLRNLIPNDGDTLAWLRDNIAKLRFDGKDYVAS